MSRCPGCQREQHTPACPYQWSGPGALIPAAEEAIFSGRIVKVPSLGLCVVPDLLAIERVANGEPVARTTLVRRDGRSASVYAS